MLPDLVTPAHQSALRSISRVVEESTVPSDPHIAVTRIATQLRESPPLVLTGAGVSTDSGVPDYRGPSGSLSRHRPMTYQEFRHDPQASHRYWARSFVGWRRIAAAAPNLTHYMLVELEQAGLITGLVTQNVDGLHAAAGSTNLVTLHGDLARVICLNCHRLEERRHLDRRLVAANQGYLESIDLDPSLVNPDGDVTLNREHVQRFHMVGCEQCGSKLLKPDVVYFGEPVPDDRKQAAARMLENAPGLLVVGSSLAVMSGYRFVLDARRQGKPVSVINGGPGRADPKADILWRTPVAPAFLRLVDELGLS